MGIGQNVCVCVSVVACLLFFSFHFFNKREIKKKKKRNEKRKTSLLTPSESAVCISARCRVCVCISRTDGQNTVAEASNITGFPFFFFFFSGQLRKTRNSWPPPPSPENISKSLKLKREKKCLQSRSINCRMTVRSFKTRLLLLLLHLIFAADRLSADRLHHMLIIYKTIISFQIFGF